MGERDSAVFGHLGQGLHTGNGFFAPGRLVNGIFRVIGVAHYPNKLRAQSFHPGNRLLQVINVDLGVTGNRTCPVGDSAAKAGNFHLGFLHRGHHGVKIGVAELGNIVSVHHAQFQVLPTQIFVGLNLDSNGLTGFVTNTGEKHSQFLVVLVRFT